MSHGQRALDGRRYGANGDSAEPGEGGSDASEVEVGLPGMSLERLLTAVPGYVTSAEATGTLGLPAAVGQHCPWIVMLPTHRLCRRVAGELIDAALTQAEVGILARIAIAPWRPLIESIAADPFAAERERLLYEVYILSQPDWGDAEKRERIADYRQRHAARSQQQLQMRVGQALESKSPASKPSDAAQPDADP